jgi:hypothetical protein
LRKVEPTTPHALRAPTIVIGLPLLVLLIALSAATRLASAAPVVLPVEVAGDAGTTVSIAVDVPRAGEVRSLWMHVHGLSFADMASVQVNGDEWLPLNNGSAAVAEPGKSYGGIGGGFATLKLTIPLTPGAVAEGRNTIRFRFNGTNGVASGFRVLACNFLAGDGRTRILPASTFEAEDPNAWAPPFPDARSIADGRKWWGEAALTASGLPNAAPIRAHCADCHARDGRDLKYFNFSNASIVARSRFHGLTRLQGEQIASYIRSLPVVNPGRPWGPPYQPGPGLETQPPGNWAAGAGLDWVLDDDRETLGFIFPGKVGVGGTIVGSTGDAVRITKDVFRPDGDLNARDVPISLQLPDWNHWLPRVHPLDAWGNEFVESDLSKLYQQDNGSAGEILKARLASAERAGPDGLAAVFKEWSNSRHRLLEGLLPGASGKWSPDLTEKAYSSQLWQLVKTWEMTQELRLEARGGDGPFPEPRIWFNAIPAATAPDAVGIPDGPNGIGGSALTNEYFNNAWYELQVLLDGGRGGRLPIDRRYMIGRFRNLYHESRRAEPGRLLVAVIKALQSTDPAIGPENATLGWRPDENVDPRIMISPQWTPMFEPLSADVRRSITESMLSAWLDKNQRYPASGYFTRGPSDLSYALPEGLAGISGGKVWEAAPRFQAAGDSPAVVLRLNNWGRAQADMASRFAY